MLSLSDILQKCVILKLSVQQKEFEYERRFFVTDFPHEFDSGLNPHLIIQNYYLSSDGYAIRIRTQSTDLNIEMSINSDILQILDKNYTHFDISQMTVKGPGVGGTRYEVEQTLDPVVAKELIKRGGKSIIKNRYNAWIGSDGWVIDVFGGQNYGLIIAECERTSPVVDLEIPPFCKAEITDDRRFSNDSLVNIPYSEFRDEYLEDLSNMKNNLERNVGADTGQFRVRNKLYSKQFGENRFI